MMNRAMVLVLGMALRTRAMRRRRRRRTNSMTDDNYKYTDPYIDDL